MNPAELEPNIKISPLTICVPIQKTNIACLLVTERFVVIVYNPSGGIYIDI